MEGKTKLNNRLWQARHRLGLGQKQVARLLGHKSTDQLSRYERGARTPNLSTACKLAIIYGVSVQEIFAEHNESYRREIRARADVYSASLLAANNLPTTVNAAANAVGELIGEKMQQLHFPNNAVETLEQKDAWLKESSSDSSLCHYARLLDKPGLTKTESDAVRKHLTKLTRTMAYL